MNTWYNIDDLGFERMGLPRNLLMAVFGAGFIFYLILDATWGKNLTGMADIAPLPITIGLWWFFVIPTVRDLNDKLPAGYWRGVYSYYFTNPGNLEITSDPEPMPLYIPDKLRESVNKKPGVENQPNQKAQ